jgi:hypothetical protein
MRQPSVRGVHVQCAKRCTTAAMCLLIGMPLHVRAQDAIPEFRFESAAARVLLHQARKAHGLETPRPLALIGTVVRGEMTDHIAIVVDVRGKYKRANATIQGSGSAQRLTGMVTHILDGNTYRKVPPGSPEMAAVAHPRLEREFNRMSVTILLRPPRGQEMTVRADQPVEFNGEPAIPLHVALGGEAVCTLFVRQRDATVAGWSTNAETSAGFIPQVVVVEAVKAVDGIRLPIVLRERTGDTYRSLTSFTTVVTGDAALREFMGDQ